MHARDEHAALFNRLPQGLEHVPPELRQLVEEKHDHDILALAREKLFGWTRPVSQTQYTQPFPFGLRTLRATMIEIALVEHFYGKRLREEPLPAFDDYPISETRQPTFADLERVWTALAQETGSRSRESWTGIAP